MDVRRLVDVDDVLLAEVWEVAAAGVDLFHGAVPWIAVEWSNGPFRRKFLDEFLDDGALRGGEGDADECDALAGERILARVVLALDLLHRLGGGAVELELHDVDVVRRFGDKVDPSVVRHPRPLSILKAVCIFGSTFPLSISDKLPRFMLSSLAS